MKPAALLSLVIPGFGQLVLRRWLLAGVFFGAAVYGWLHGSWLVGVTHLGAAWHAWLVTPPATE